MAQLRIKQNEKVITEFIIYENGSNKIGGTEYYEKENGVTYSPYKEGGWYLNYSYAYNGNPHYIRNVLTYNATQFKKLLPFTPTKLKITWKASSTSNNTNKNISIYIGSKIIYLLNTTKNSVNIGERTDIYDISGVNFDSGQIFKHYPDGWGNIDRTNQRLNFYVKNLSLLKK